MLTLLTTVIGSPILGQQEGTVLGKIREAIIEPDKGKIAAYRLANGKFIVTVDVLSYLKDGVVVQSADAMQPDQDLARVKTLLKKNVPLLKLPVITDRGRKLGRISDCLFETDGHFIAKLHIRPPLWQRLFEAELIIPREQIVRITPREVVVRYDVKAKAPGVEPEIAQ